MGLFDSMLLGPICGVKRGQFGYPPAVVAGYAVSLAEGRVGEPAGVVGPIGTTGGVVEGDEGGAVTGYGPRSRGRSHQGQVQRERARLASAVGGGLDGVGAGGQGLLYLRDAGATPVVVVLVQRRPGGGIPPPQVQIGVGVGGNRDTGWTLLGRNSGCAAAVLRLG